MAAIPIKRPRLARAMVPAFREPAIGVTLERMDQRFDGATGNGIVEIWVPLKG